MPTDMTPPGEVPTCVAEVFATGCGGTVCHYGGSFQFPPSLERAGLQDLLAQETSTCSEAGNPTFLNLEDGPSSYLMKKIKGEQPTSCGGVMPPAGSPALTETQLQCLEDWLAAL